MLNKSKSSASKKPIAKKSPSKKPAPRRAARPTAPAKSKVPPKPPAKSKAPPKPASMPAPKGKTKPAVQPSPTREPEATKPARKKKAADPAPESPAKSSAPASPPEAAPPQVGAPSPSSAASAIDAPAPKAKKKRKSDPDDVEVSADPGDDVEIPGEALDGKRVATAILYAAKVTPRDRDLVFTRDAKGRGVISGHDQRRCHTAYFTDEAAFHLRGSVPREAADKLAKALKGLSGPRVRIGVDGCVLIRHGVGQPAMRIMLGRRPITQGWEPPSMGDRSASSGPLKVPAAWESAALRWSHATAQSAQSDGIEFIELQDEVTGELLARAVLAGEGRDLYAEDERQGEIPGSRTVGMGGGGVGVGRAVDGLRNTLREHGATMTVVSGDQRVTVGGEAPVTARVWIARESWVGVGMRTLSEIMELLVSDTVYVDAVPGWTRADVRESHRNSLETLAAAHGIALHWGDAPPADEATVLVDGKPVVADAPTPAADDAVAAPAEHDSGEGRVWIAQPIWDDLSPEAAKAVTELVEPGSLANVDAAWVSARVAGVARRALVKVAGEYDVTLHWGDEAPRTNAAEVVAEATADLTAWVREADWDALSSGSYNELTKLLGEDGLVGTAGWISVAVPGAKSAAFRTLALRLKLAFEEGDVPPGGTAPAAATEPELPFEEGDDGDDDAGDDD